MYFVTGVHCQSAVSCLFSKLKVYEICGYPGSQLINLMTPQMENFFEHERRCKRPFSYSG